MERLVLWEQRPGLGTAKSELSSAGWQKECGTAWRSGLTGSTAEKIWLLTFQRMRARVCVYMLMVSAHPFLAMQPFSDAEANWTVITSSGSYSTEESQFMYSHVVVLIFTELCRHWTLRRRHVCLSYTHQIKTTVTTSGCVQQWGFYSWQHNRGQVRQAQPVHLHSLK